MMNDECGMMNAELRACLSFIIPHSSLRVSEERVRVDVLARPEAPGVGDAVDLKMEVRVAGACIPRVADVADGLAAAREVSFRQAVGVAVEVRVVEHEVLVRGGELVDGRAALRAPEEFDDATVRGGDDGRAARGRDVYGVVDAPLASRLVEGVAKLRRPHARDRDQQAHR